VRAPLSLARLLTAVRHENFPPPCLGSVLLHRHGSAALVNARAAAPGLAQFGARSALDGALATAPKARRRTRRACSVQSAHAQ
jgi:hypothetical protein